jgi:transposase
MENYMARPKVQCKREIIKQLHIEGLSTPEIAERADTTIGAVRSTLSMLRKRGELDQAAPRTTLTKALGNLDLRTVRALRLEAQRRKVSPSDLAVQIIATALRDGIVGAILDDKEPDT